MTKVNYPLNVCVELITPEEAINFLAGNVNNRTVRATRVTGWANTMRTGRWKLSPQGIVLDPAGRLLDGQHRLKAIVQSGVPVLMVVFRDWDSNVYDVLDMGDRRMMKDVLRADGRIVEACNYLVRLRGVKSIQPHHTRAVMDEVGEHLNELISTAGAAARGRSAAPVKAAAALRIKQGHREYVLRQYRALVGLDIAEMSPAIGALLKQLERGAGPKQGSTEQNDRAVRAWMAFDPARAAVTKIQVNDLDGMLQEMRGVYNPDFGGSALIERANVAERGYDGGVGHARLDAGL